MLELYYKESWASKNWSFWTVVLEKTLKSPLACKEVQLVNPEGNQSWIFIGRTDAEAETTILWPPDAESTHWKRPWCWKRLKTGEGDDGGWDGWRVSPMQWTWVCVGSGSWWWTGKSGVLQSIGSQRVGHNWVTELNWTRIPSTGCSVESPLRYFRFHLFLLLERAQFKAKSFRESALESKTGALSPSLGTSMTNCITLRKSSSFPELQISLLDMDKVTAHSADKIVILPTENFCWLNS